MNPDLLEVSYRLAVAASIGLLIGLQREFAHRRDSHENDGELLFAGVRTMTLVALLGFCVAAMHAQLGFAGFLPAAALLVVGGLIGLSYFRSSRLGQHGLTSEISALVVFVLGLVAYAGPLSFVAVAGVGTATILAGKKLARGLIDRLTETDLHAFLLFGVLAVIILPLLPKVGPTLEPFTVLVPFRIGLMVVFISGVNFFGYVLTKVFGNVRGTGLAGAVGGLVSSTAVTLSFSRRSKVSAALSQYLAIGIVLSWAIMFARVILEVAAINPGLTRSVVLPLGAALTASILYGIMLYLKSGDESIGDSTEYKNPVDLGPAITFGALFAVILLVANAAHLYFGETGVYVSSAISGIADVDAITLSMSELSRSNSLSDTVASRAIVIAAISNTIVKAGIVAVIGDRALRRIILPGTLLIIAAAAVTALI